MPRLPIRSYRDLIVWNKAMTLAVAVHRFCEERRAPSFFSLTDQLRQAANSIPANIAEGYGRRSRGDYRRFISIANASRCEMETHLLLSRRIQPGWEEQVDRILVMSEEVARMLTGLHRALKHAP